MGSAPPVWVWNQLTFGKEVCNGGADHVHPRPLGRMLGTRVCACFSTAVSGFSAVHSSWSCHLFWNCFLSPSLPRPMHTLPACSEGPARPSPALGENTRACRQAPQQGARWAGVILGGLREQVPCGGSYLEQPQQLLPRMGPSGSTRKGGEDLPSPTI